MKLFMPERVLFEPTALSYPLGRELYEFFLKQGTEIANSTMQNISRQIPGKTEQQKYVRSKRTLVVAVKKTMKLDVCRPSADYEFSLVTNCPGNCEYCYLQTTQGKKPFLRAYVNLDEIFQSIEKHIAKNEKEITTFEAASAGDPLSLEHLTGSLGKTINFFGTLPNARLRVVTKFDNVDSLLGLEHRGRTRFRVSINSRYVIDTFEHNTANFDERINAASKLAIAGYPIGFIVAPIMLYDGWQTEYLELFDKLKEQIDLTKTEEPVTFELIQHRFTPTAKNLILQRFPLTKLDMDENKRALKWGKYGKFKYVYPKETAGEIRDYITGLLESRFPNARIEYFT